MTIREERERINDVIKFRRDRIREHEVQIAVELKHLSSLFRDGGLMAYDLMSDKEKAIVDKMPRAELPCEYCGEDKVKQGRKTEVCIGCGHEQGKSV